MQNTEKLVIQAQNVGIAKLKMQQNNYKRAYKPLKIRCDALEQSVAGKDLTIDKLRKELAQERQTSAIVRSEHAMTVEKLKLRIRAVLR